MRLGLLCAATVLCFGVLGQTQCPTEDMNSAEPTGSQGSPPAPPPEPAPTPSGPTDGNQDDYTPPAVPWDGVSCPIIINEVLAHSDNEAPDWIELHNIANAPVNIGGWLLSDREDDLRKFRVPANTVVEPLGYIVFYQSTDFGNPANPNTLTPFALTENGETVYLYSDDDPQFPDCLVEETVGPSERNWSLGRHTTSDGNYHFTTMSRTTVGAANAYPLVGPVVINEIMYDPATNYTEYVELLNISDQPVILFDTVSEKPWRFINDSGVEMRFPADAPVTMASGEYLLVVRNASDLRVSVPPNVKVFEWRSGKLGNRDDTVLLVKPGDEDEKGTRYWIEVDRVDYSDGLQGDNFPNNGNVDPWPPAPETSGMSLNRISPDKFGNDPSNWRAAAPTPGAVNN